MADVRFGFVLEINGQEIPLEPKTAIGKITEGIEVALPPGTEVRMRHVGGGLKGLVDSLVTAFGGTAITWPANLPKPLDGTLEYLDKLDVTINDLWIRFPKDFGTPKDYRIGVYAGGDAVSLVGNTLKFKGFVVQLAAGDGLNR
jgi:hypothetical protein